MVLCQAYKLKHFKPHNTVQEDFTNIKDFQFHLIGCETFLSFNAPKFLPDAGQTLKHFLKSYLPMT